MSLRFTFDWRTWQKEEYLSRVTSFIVSAATVKQIEKLHFVRLVESTVVEG